MNGVPLPDERFMVARWDITDWLGKPRSVHEERRAWLAEHLPAALGTWCWAAEFYLIDVPVAVTRSWAFGEDGAVVLDVNGETLLSEPSVIPLSALPPESLWDTGHAPW